MKTQTSNNTLTINELHSDFTQLTKMSATEANAIAALEQLNLGIDLSELNFKKPATWLEVNQLIINSNNSTINDDLDDDDLDDDETIEVFNDTSKKRIDLDNWIEDLDRVNWNEFNSQCDIKIVDDTHLSLDGIYKIGAKKQFNWSDKKLVAKFNYGTGNIYLSSDYENYFLLGSIDRQKFTPVLPEWKHDRIMRNVNPSESMLSYRSAIAAIENKLVRANTLKINRKKVIDRETKKLKRSNLSNILDLASNK